MGKVFYPVERRAHRSLFQQHRNAHKHDRNECCRNSDVPGKCKRLAHDVLFVGRNNQSHAVDEGLEGHPLLLAMIFVGDELSVVGGIGKGRIYFGKVVIVLCELDSISDEWMVIDFSCCIGKVGIPTAEDGDVAHGLCQHFEVDVYACRANQFVAIVDGDGIGKNVTIRIGALSDGDPDRAFRGGHELIPVLICWVWRNCVAGHVCGMKGFAR